MALSRTEDGDEVFPEDVQAMMPTLGEVPYAISNFNDEVSFEIDGDNVMWQGGQYFFKLAAIQGAIQERDFQSMLIRQERINGGLCLLWFQPTYLDFEVLTSFLILSFTNFLLLNHLRLRQRQKMIGIHLAGLKKFVASPQLMRNFRLVLSKHLLWMILN